MIFRILILFVFFFNGNALDAQTERDSIETLPYDSLRLKFIENIEDNQVSNLYAQAYLKKAKRDSIPARVAYGYHIASLSSIGQQSIQYIDSLINYTEKRNIPNYPVSGYILKGQHYYDNLDYKLTLDYFLKADSLLKADSNPELIYQTKTMIAVLKGRIGFHREAIDLLKEILVHYENTEVDYKVYLTTFAIAESFNFLKMPDSTKYYLDKAMSFRPNPESSPFYEYLKASSIGMLYEQGNYKAAIDSSLSVQNFLIEQDDAGNLAFLHYYKAKAYKGLGENRKSLENLMKVDSIFIETKDIHPELRDNWESLIEFHREKDDFVNELKYVKRLLFVDSIQNDNYKYLNNNIKRKYDFPQLVQMKDDLINRYEEKNKNFFMRNIYLSVLAGLLLVLLIFYIIRERKKTIAFQQTIEKLKTPQTKKIKSRDKLPLSKDLYDTIASKLKGLEEEQFYLDNKMSSEKLSKKIGHNYNYISKYINHSKGKNFTQYLNDLRISHAIEKFRNDPTFRNYSLSAVAKEVGFNSTEYFSKAFKKKTNITPTYFLKKLEND